MPSFAPLPRRMITVCAFLVTLSAAPAANAQKEYDIGATDTEIKIGNIMPYSGPASGYAAIGKVMVAYFAKINAEGGINGRKITFLSQDDGYQPPKTLEVVRKLVESDEVLFTAGILGTPTNSAIQKYMNTKKVPQLFVATGATKWGDPKNFPWTMGWQPSYQTEGRIQGRHVAKAHPDAKIAILYQDDDSGKDYVRAFKEGLGAKAAQILIELPYQVTDPTIDSQVVSMKAAGADTIFVTGIPKYSAMAIRKVNDLAWKPNFSLTSVGASTGATLIPAGLEKSVGIVTAAYIKDPTDKRWETDAGVAQWRAFMDKHMADTDISDSGYVYGYTMAQNIAYVIKQCGDELTRETIMKKAASIKSLELPMLLPGITVSTSATDFFPIKQMQMARFDGKSWVLFGDVISADLPQN